MLLQARFSASSETCSLWPAGGQEASFGLMLQAWGAGGLVFLVGAGCLLAAIVLFMSADVARD